ncbi:hypothetical protein SEMRO_590_G171940.1 [Seminavis robusta]|uniref:Uncharacterized protein n=1 Tax=Seminavis robusta TaxID=568900 RepID=A0A9N8E2L5_9STRA|nr:hypothetical protein SEMRO_590_G171940.1 [Seminavis robusta]|eukprot:Sro590_g171940.1 n/a (96) ;mRNA; f:54650-54937
MKKGALKQLWDEKYAALNSPNFGWTSDDDDELERLQSGTIVDFPEDVGLQSRWDTEDEEIATRLQTIDKGRRHKVLLEVLRSMKPDEADDVFADV